MITKMLKTLFQRPAQPAADLPRSKTMISIAKANPTNTAPPGQEMAHFVTQIQDVLDRPMTREDLHKDLKTELGLDEFDIAECLIITEEAWGRSTPRRPIDPNDPSSGTVPYRTLLELIEFVRRH